MSSSSSPAPGASPARPSRPSFDAATRAITPPATSPNSLTDKLKQMSYDTPIDQVQVSNSTSFFLLRALFYFTTFLFFFHTINYEQLWMKEPVTREEVLARNIPWDGYVRGALVSEQDMSLIRAFDKKEQNIKNEILVTVHN